MRKTALLTGVAGLFLMTAPAFAQEAAAQTPAPAQTPAAPAAQTLTLQPGAAVRGSDGTELGKLVGVQTGASGQELTVRGPDGELRAVPVTGGVRQDGADIAVGWSAAQYQAAPAIAEAAQPAAPAEAADPGATPATSASPPAGEMTTPAPTEAAPPSAASEPTAQDQPGG